jgi:hypothetical protein
LFKDLKEINSRPKPFQFYTADELWTNEHTSKQMLDKYTIIEASRKRVVYNWLQCYSEDSIRNEFEESGFKADELYSDVAGKAFTSEATEIAIVAKKS